MTTLSEGKLQVTLPSTANGRKFDGAAHGLSHCMKAVDFIIALVDSVLFIEFKDPENSDATAERSNKFVEEFLAGKLDEDLKTKFRDSWLYEYTQDRVNKPIFYLVLIGASSLSDAELLARTDALKRLLPTEGPPNQAWVKPLVAGCSVLNIAKWNQLFPNLPIIRIN